MHGMGFSFFNPRCPWIWRFIIVSLVRSTFNLSDRFQILINFFCRGKKNLLRTFSCPSTLYFGKRHCNQDVMHFFFFFAVLLGLFVRSNLVSK